MKENGTLTWFVYYQGELLQEKGEEEELSPFMYGMVEKMTL